MLSRRTTIPIGRRGGQPLCRSTTPRCCAGAPIRRARRVRPASAADERLGGPAPAIRRRAGRAALLRAPRVRDRGLRRTRAHTAVYRAFTARHPRFLVTSAKRWGVALTPLPDGVRGLRRRGLAEGPAAEAEARGEGGLPLRARLAAGAARRDHGDQPLARRSARAAPMDDRYLDREAVSRAFRGARRCPRDPRCRRTASRVCARARHRRRGRVLAGCSATRTTSSRARCTSWCSEAIRASIEAPPTGRDAALGDVRHLLGRRPRGCAYFKERVGFRQYTVDWVWVDRKPSGPSATGSGTP